jgi:hypothetical protein
MSTPQQSHDFNMAPCTCNPQRITAIGADCLPLRPTGEEQSNDFRIPLVGRQEQRPVHFVGRQVRVRPVPEEESDDSGMTVEGRPEQRGPTLRVGKIDIRTGYNQLFGDGEVSIEYSVEEQAVAVSILPIHSSTLREKLAHPFRIASLHGSQGLLRNPIERATKIKLLRNTSRCLRSDRQEHTIICLLGPIPELRG